MGWEWFIRNGRDRALPLGGSSPDLGNMGGFWQCHPVMKQHQLGGCWACRCEHNARVSMGHFFLDQYASRSDHACDILCCAVLLCALQIPLPLPRLPYAEAMAKYGSDKPDLRCLGDAAGGPLASAVTSAVTTCRALPTFRSQLLDVAFLMLCTHSLHMHTHSIHSGCTASVAKATVAAILFHCRYGLEFVDVSSAVAGCGFRVFEAALSSGGVVKAIRVPDGKRISNSRLKAPKGDVVAEAMAAGEGQQP